MSPTVEDARDRLNSCLKLIEGHQVTPNLRRLLVRKVAEVYDTLHRDGYDEGWVDSRLVLRAHLLTGHHDT